MTRPKPCPFGGAFAFRGTLPGTLIIELRRQESRPRKKAALLKLGWSVGYCAPPPLAPPAPPAPPAVPALPAVPAPAVPLVVPAEPLLFEAVLFDEFCELAPLLDADEPELFPLLSRWQAAAVRRIRAAAGNNANVLRMVSPGELGDW
jgi:hypothetical protein